MKGGRCSSGCMNFIIVGHGCYEKGKHLLPKEIQLDYYTLENYRLTLKTQHQHIIPNEYCAKRMTKYYEPVDYTEGGHMYKEMKIWSDKKTPAYLAICKGDKMNILSTIQENKLSVIIRWLHQMYKEKIHIALLTCRPDCTSGSDLSIFQHRMVSYQGPDVARYKKDSIERPSAYFQSLTEKEIKELREDHKKYSPHQDLSGYYN